MTHFLFKNFLSLLIISALVMLLGCNSKDRQQLEPGISKVLASERKTNISDIVYDLSFDIPKSKTLPIQAELIVKFSQQVVNDLILDFNASSKLIKSVYVQGNQVNFQVENEHVIVAKQYLSKESEVKIVFTAGDQSLNRQEDYLYTLFVPERASTCFPVFDQPNLKAKYKLKLNIPSEWKAVANGSIMRQTENDNKTLYEFEETLPISSYLFAFAAGDFMLETRDVGGREMNLYHRESDSVKVSRNINEIFDWHRKSLSWLEDYTKENYPFPKFDFVLLPSFQYGGMEHPGAIFYKASSLFLDESSTLNQQIGRGRLIAHETAHMWFGNLVTMDWFNDVWLKEVFANFMAAKIVNPEFSEINHDLQFLFGHYPRAYDVDRTSGTHAIQQELDNLKNAGSLYGSIIYQKAPIVMRMLEENMGKEAFQKGIREYIRSYRFNNATWDDLVDIMKKYTDYDLSQWNAQWVKSPGMPSIEYNIESGDNKTIDELKVSVAGKQKENIWWPQHLTMMFGNASSTYHKDFLLSQPMITVDVKDRSFPDYVFSNASGNGYGYFNMESKSVDHFLKNVNQYDSSLIRGAIWVNLYESVVRGDIPAERLMKTALSSLTEEKEALILSYINRVVSAIFWNYYSDQQRTAVAAQLEGVLLNMMINSDSQNLKATFFNTLLSITTTENGTVLLKSIWENDMTVEGLTVSERDYTRLAYELAVREIEGYEAILDQQLESIGNSDRKKRMQFVRPVLSDKQEVRDQFFESLKNPANRENEEWVLEAISYLHHPLRTLSSQKYITPSLELLQEIKQTGDIFFPKRWLDNTLGAHQSAIAESAVREFLDMRKEYPDDLKSKILQSADKLFRSRKIFEERDQDQEKL